MSITLQCPHAHERHPGDDHTGWQGRRLQPRRSPSGVTYDLSGLTVMPGWIDAHTHLASHFDRDTGRIHSPEVQETPQQAMLYAAENAYKTLLAGFTTVQSPGAELDKDLRDWIAEGRVPGPRILTSLLRHESNW